ncbi:MAG: MFS transporter [Candidatus Izimaplasma sp.]|nr:MFS transporter [Candidatus Izimaplasma bacterium]
MNKEKKYLLLITLLFGILFNVGNPAVPLYTNSLDISGKFVGFYLASGGVGLMLFSTLWGSLGDIKDRNKVLAVTFFGFALGQFLFGIFHNQYLLLIASLISGMFVAGVLVNVYSYINDTYQDEQEKNRTLSYAVSIYLIGGAVAYLIGGYLAQLFAPNYGMVFIIQSILLLLSGIYIFFEKTDLVDTDQHLTRRFFWEDIKQIFTMPWVPVYTISLTFFISFSHSNVRRFLDYYVINEDYSVVQLGYLVFTVGIVSLISNIFIAPFFLKRYHNFRFLQLQFIFAPIFLYLSFQIDNLMIGLYTFFIGYSIMLAIYEPTAISFMSDNKEVSQGVLVGVRQSIVGLGMTLGFIVGGFLFEINQLYVFYFAAFFYIIVFIGFTVLIQLRKNEVKEYRRKYLKEAKKS